MNHSIRIFSVSLCCALWLSAQEPTKPAPALPTATATATAEVAAEPKPYQVAASYPLDVCVVSGETLDPEDTTTFQVDDREFRTCCGNCKKKVVAAPEKFLPKLDAALATAQRAHYPLEVCPVSKKPLGSMGEPHERVLDGVLVRMCCAGCDGRATKNAARIVEAIRDAAFAAQLAAYPLDACLVSGEELDDSAVSTMVGTQLVRTCCKNCAKKVVADPARYLPKLVVKKTDGEVPAERRDGAGCDESACVTAASGGGCCCQKTPGAGTVPAPAGGQTGGVPSPVKRDA